MFSCLPSQTYLGGRGCHADESSNARLSRRRSRRYRPYSLGRRTDSTSAPSTPPDPVFPDTLISSSPLISTTVVTPPQPQEDELELSSPPRLTIISFGASKRVQEELTTPTSPGCTIPTDWEPRVFPTYGYDSGEWNSSNGEEDPDFKEDVCKSTSPMDDIDWKVVRQRQTYEYAENALKQYNNDEKNKVKYQLIRGITSCGMKDPKGLYGHVNFIAKENQQDSKEELFFAEIHLGNYIPTCVVCLEDKKKVGGLGGSKYDNNFCVMGTPIDSQHCYACGSGVKHPKNGSLYEIGHVAIGDYYIN